MIEKIIKPLKNEYPDREMSTKIFIFISFSILLIQACTENDSPLSPGRGYGSEMDYQIYSVVIDNMYNYGSSYQIVLCDSTEFWDITDSYDYILEHFTSISEETLDNYQMTNKESIQLLNIPDLKVECHLISPGGRPRWKEIYPDADVLIHLSKVGYNSSGDQALLYISDYYAPLAGAGYLVYLEKGEDWEVKQTLMLWIS